MKIKKTYLPIAQDQPLRIMTEIVPNKVKLFIWVGKEGLSMLPVGTLKLYKHHDTTVK